MGGRGIYTHFSIILMMSGLSLSQHHVCLKYKDRGDTIDIICSVDRLKYQIVFKTPAGEENEYCGAPLRVGKGIVFCNGKFNINQDLTTNTTTLIIEKSELVYGEWKCNHGTNIGSDSVDIKMPVSNTRWDLIVPLIATVVALILLACHRFYQFVVSAKDMARWFSLKKDGTTDKVRILDMARTFLLKKDAKTDKVGVIGKTECVPKCASCNLISICAICSDCKKKFCEICCNTHNRSKPRHKVCMIEHVTTSTCEVNCEYCNNLATAACVYCAVVFCDDCTREHSGNNHNVKMLIKYNGVVYQRGNTEGTSKLERKYTISTEENVEPLSIRGIAFLTGDRILLVDYNRSEIKIFKENSFIFSYRLKQEPNCMTKLYDNRVAISFPHEREIRLYDIFNKSVNLSKIIDLKSIGKPFSISYHKKYFAVEIGEGKNGGISIINGHGKVKCSVPNVRSFAFFTGNTIRLALDMKNRCIFVSALGSKSVHCIDFDGHIVWYKAIPSPRGIVFIPEASSNMNMIVASNQWNIIYKINSHNGTDNIITAEGLIKGPRHMDYNIQKKLLCVEIDNGNILVFKYDINMLD